MLSLHGNGVTVKNHIIVDNTLINADHMTIFSDRVLKIKMLQIQISDCSSTTLLVLIGNPHSKNASLNLVIMI